MLNDLDVSMHCFEITRTSTTTTSDSKGQQRMTLATNGHEIAFTILREFERAYSELVGRGVILSDGKAGSIEHIFLDELHGLRISIEGHEGRWPISTVKFSQRA